MKIAYFPVGLPEFNAIEECWRQRKYNILSNYYPSFSQLKQLISRYYITTRFNLLCCTIPPFQIHFTHIYYQQIV